MPTSQGPAAPFIAELEEEAVATRRLIERIPADRLDWRPHAKSYTLGQLAMHVAVLPGIVTGLLSGNEVDVETVDFRTRFASVSRQPASVDEIRHAFEEKLADARDALSRWGAGDLATTWRLRAGSKELMAAPKAALLRSLVCNHLYHHRGQLTVYLRLLDVPLPPVYGPTADDPAFAEATSV